jgi:GAG-pre-integrase domain
LDKSSAINAISVGKASGVLITGKGGISRKMANAASVKMSVTEAHRKLGHISISSIKHAVLKQLITGIDVNFESKFEFCEACAKAKSVHQPFLKESETRAKNFGEHVH